MEKKQRKTIKIRKERTKWSQKGAQREPEERKGSKTEPKGSKMEPKGTKMEPKATKMEPKGAKREPKGDQSASKSRLGSLGRFWERKSGTRTFC